MPGPFEQAFPDEVTKELRKGYYAAVSWADSQIQRVLDELESLGFANNTVVALVGAACMAHRGLFFSCLRLCEGDHGYQLGEKVMPI